MGHFPAFLNTKIPHATYLQALTKTELLGANSRTLQPTPPLPSAASLRLPAPVYRIPLPSTSILHEFNSVRVAINTII